jgi:hypothetical protein
MNGNRLGPENKGPKTGRALGYCAGHDQPGFMSEQPLRQAGRGRRRGGRQAGRMGFGMGQGTRDSWAEDRGEEVFSDSNSDLPISLCKGKRLNDCSSLQQ